MNILLSSVGRRAYLVKYFKQAVGKDGEVHVSNSDPNTVAFYYADQAIVSPLIYDKDYIPFLLSYCKDNRIDILISLFDIDLPILAREKDHFAEIGTMVIVSAPEIIDICNDKWKTFRFLCANSFLTPKTFIKLEHAIEAIRRGEINYPVVVKPRFGCGSIAVDMAYNEEELRFCFNRNKERINKTYLKYESAASNDTIIIQECLCGHEYGADVINNLEGAFQNAIIRKKIAMRAGETDAAEIVHSPAIYDAMSRLSRITKHVANMDCDLFLVDEKPYILEMNARFGGGYPFSHLAGCDLPKAIVLWAKGKNVAPELLQAQIGVKGYKELYLTRV